MKKGIEELWASERVARSINSLEYKEIALKSDTESATTAFRNCVAEHCNAVVTLEDAVKGDKPSDGLVENAVVLLRGVIRTIKLHGRRILRRLPNLVVVGGTCGEHLVQVPEGSRRLDVIRMVAWQEACTKVCALRREGSGETILGTVEQSESQIQVQSVAVWETTAPSASRGRQKVWRERSGGKIEHQDRWDKKSTT